VFGVRDAAGEELGQVRLKSTSTDVFTGPRNIVALPAGQKSKMQAVPSRLPCTSNAASLDFARSHQEVGCESDVNRVDHQDSESDVLVFSLALGTSPVSPKLVQKTCGL
jgi:hypothetical protein